MSTPPNQPVSEDKPNQPTAAVPVEHVEPIQPAAVNQPQCAALLAEEPKEKMAVVEPASAIAAEAPILKTESHGVAIPNRSAGPSRVARAGERLKRLRNRLSLSKKVAAAGEWSENIRKFITNSIIIVLVLMLVYTAYKEMTQDILVINSIEVPKEFADRGHSPTAVALRLNDGIQEMLKGGSTHLQREEIRPLNSKPDTERPDIVVPGGNLSLKTIIGYLRYALNWPEPRVGGTISKEGDQLHLLLRQDDRAPKLLKAATLDELLTLGAEEVVMSKSPLLAAGYFLEYPDRDKGFVKAEAALNYEMKNKPDQAVVFHMFGEIFRKRNQLDYANESYKNATIKDPKEPASYNNWGNALSQMGNYEGAIAKYQKAAELAGGGKDASVPYRNWCSALIKLGKPGEALNKCEKAVELNNNYAAAYYFWGDAFYALNQFEDAAAKFQKAAEFENGRSHAYRGWGMALANLGRFDEAIEKYHKATELNPNDATAYLSWGLALQHLKKYPEAIEKMKKAAEISPTYAEAYEYWGHLLTQLGRNREAKAKYEEARRLKSSESPAQAQ